MTTETAHHSNLRTAITPPHRTHLSNFPSCHIRNLHQPLFTSLHFPTPPHRRRVASIMSTPSPPETPTRRLQLLEARMRTPGVAPSVTVSPSQPPPTPVPPPQIEDSDSVRSFSSDLSQRTPPLSVPPATNSRRKYAPPPKPRKLGRKRKRPASNVKAGRLDEFFKPAQSPARPMRLFHSPAHPSDPTQHSSDDLHQIVDPAPPQENICYAQADSYAYLRGTIERLNAQNKQLQDDCRQVDTLAAQNEDLLTQIQVEVQPLRDQIDDKEKKINEERAKRSQLSNVLRDYAINLAKMQREEARTRAAADSERLGKAVVERSRTSLRETWVDGSEWRAVDDELWRLSQEKDVIERKRKEFAKKRLSSQKTKDVEEMPPPPSPLHRDPGVPFEDTPDYGFEQEDVCRIQLQLLKKKENLVHEKRLRFARERELLVRELRRQGDERTSEFSDFPVMNQRYQLLNLLGRGGFSQVFKALDIDTACHVACKIHQLASNWSEEKKRSFIRHAMREYEIHKTLKHPRVIQLVDIFEIDENTFCTVLEYCNGCDLDSYLRAHKTIPEKEARCIISQVFSGLLYLAEQKRRIIHYDLKPGNILLNNGEVQITDFGLSKIMNESESSADGMELTSQGAGTMWYLPPECFDAAGQARISVKVDVWSAGVILFQMLYGRKPFGHDQSQEKMFREKTVQHQELTFPAKPSVSDLAKDFMGKCLTRKAASRPDVRQALMHPFLRKQ